MCEKLKHRILIKNGAFINAYLHYYFLNRRNFLVNDT